MRHALLAVALIFWGLSSALGAASEGRAADEATQQWLMVRLDDPQAQ